MHLKETHLLVFTAVHNLHPRKLVCDQQSMAEVMVNITSELKRWRMYFLLRVSLSVSILCSLTLSSLDLGKKDTMSWAALHNHPQGKELRPPGKESTETWSLLPTATQVSMEAEPLTLGKPSDAWIRGQYLDCKLVRDPKPEITHYAVPRFLPFRNCVKYWMLIF